MHVLACMRICTCVHAWLYPSAHCCAACTSNATQPYHAPCSVATLLCLVSLRSRTRVQKRSLPYVPSITPYFTIPCPVLFINCKIERVLYARTHARTHTRAHTHTRARTRARTHTHTYTRTRTHTHTHTPAHTHTHTHTHTQRERERDTHTRTHTERDTHTVPLCSSFLLAKTVW